MYMGYKGFQTADTAEPYFELMYQPFEEDASLPHFRDSVRRHEVLSEKKFDKIIEKAKGR